MKAEFAMFLFHTGSIKSPRLIKNALSRMSRAGFYSILVRLKANRPMKRLAELQTFLFHTGSIKSRRRDYDITRQNGVSIPYWFD